MNKWIINDKSIVDSQTSELICVLPSAPDGLRDKVIEVSPELFEAAVDFVNAIESSSFRPKTAYNRFKEIFSRIPEEHFYDQRLQV